MRHRGSGAGRVWVLGRARADEAGVSRRRGGSREERARRRDGSGREMGSQGRVMQMRLRTTGWQGERGRRQEWA